MKSLIGAAIAAALLTGCVVAPIEPAGRVVIQPSVSISYEWDNVRLRYYYVDRGERRYMDRGWVPPGHRKHKHKHKRYDD